jgi:hypothetical protein
MERERAVYEEASADEENAFIEIGIELLGRMNPPPGWTKHKKPGRPRKKHVGHPVEFRWKGMAMVLLPKTRRRQFRASGASSKFLLRCENEKEDSSQ